MKYHIEFDIDFRRNPYKGIYIALEGIDGSGKSTQVERLKEYFQKKGKEVVTTREPRKTEGIIGKMVQEILYGNIKVPSVAFQYLFSADRAMNHEELILPSLKAGKVVISDRCFWSAVPYGVLDRGGDSVESENMMGLVSQSILSMYNQFTLPDYTIYLDVSSTTAMQRIDEIDGKKEIYEDQKKLATIHKVYSWLVEQFPQEFIVIKGKQPVEKITKEIISNIKK